MAENLTTKFRASQLKAMHKVIMEANDETIYYTWVTFAVPDCPDDDDFYYVAEDDDSYNHCIDLFVELVSKKGFRC